MTEQVQSIELRSALSGFESAALNFGIRFILGLVMNVRSVVTSSIFVTVFLAFLIWLYFIGKISIFGIIAILVAGGIFVAISKLLYKNFWGEEYV